MLWNAQTKYLPEPFEYEAELEEAILEVCDSLFGPKRIYLDSKKKIGARGKIRSIPDGYLMDLSSEKEPNLYVVENELAKHDPLKHIAVQILEFSLSFETSPHTVKGILKDSLLTNPAAMERCQRYAEENGLDNVDVLLERMIYGEDRFRGLVVIDDLSEELEKVLITRFQFPVEIITLERYKTLDGERLYRFEPFLEDVTGMGEHETDQRTKPPLDPAEIDTVVVAAREEGFQETFLGENRWYKIRIHSSMIPKIKYIAGYQVAPTSAITHVAPVASIETWKDSNKYVVNFAEPARKIGPIRLVPKGAVKAPQAPRYTSYERLQSAENLDEAF